MQILRKLKDQSNPEKVHKVYITPDLSPSEQVVSASSRLHGAMDLLLPLTVVVEPDIMTISL